MTDVRRSRFFRVAGVLAGVWFGLLTSGLGVAHACPVHDGGARGAAAAHAGHHGGLDHGASEHGAPSRAPGAHSCNCIGACCMATLPAPPAVVVRWTVRVHAPPAAVAWPSGALQALTLVEHARPPSQAPPQETV